MFFPARSLARQRSKPLDHMRSKRHTFFDSLQIAGANAMSVFLPRPDPASDRLIHILEGTRREPRYRRVNDRNALLNGRELFFFLQSVACESTTRVKTITSAATRP